MGNNASKERKPDSETAEWENQHHVPSLYRSSSKKRKTIDEVRFIDESKNTLNIAEEENRNNMELAPTQTDLSAVIGHNDCVRDRKELHTLSNVICDQGTVESGKEQSGVRRKKKKHYSTSHVNKTKTETNKVLSVDKKQNDQQLIGKMNGIDQQLIASKMNGIDQQLIASKMNGIVQDISSDFATHPPISAFSAIQAPAFSAIKAPVFSAIQASEFINSTDQTHNAEMEDGNSTGTHIAWACYDDAEASTKSTPLVATASAGLTKSTENDCKSKSELRTKSSSGLPEPSLMQHVSTVGSVSATGSSSTPSLFSTNFSVQSSLQTSYPVLVSNVGSVASSNSSLFRSPVFTQSQPTATASAFGNFPYSGNVLPYVTTSSISPSTTNSSSLLPNRFSYGNFSMSSGASTTGRNSPGVTPSNSHLDALQPNRHSFNMYASQTNVSVGSSSNSLSVFTTNNSTSQTSFDGSPYTTSHTSLTVDTNVSDSLSYMTNDNLRNSPDGIVRNRDVLEYEVEEDAMDHLYADGFAFQTDMSSHNESRNTNNFDRDYIFIRTSVGDTITQISAKNITLNTNYVDNDLTDENMGIILERPKYPRYATLASREKSFENLWPPSNKMCWVKLPEAGFVYTG